MESVTMGYDHKKGVWFVQTWHSVATKWGIVNNPGRRENFDTNDDAAAYMERLKQTIYGGKSPAESEEK